MQSIEVKKAQRFLYLKRLYEIADGNLYMFVNFRQLGDELGFDETTTASVAFYLRDERLMRFATFGHVAITHLGTKYIEEALSNPDHGTKYFPPASSIVIIANGNITIGGDVIGRDKTNVEK